MDSPCHFTLSYRCCKWSYDDKVKSYVFLNDLVAILKKIPKELWVSDIYNYKIL